jgi:hypothetical protein
LEGFTHTCGQCDKAHKTRYGLQQHISLRHKGVKEEVEDVSENSFEEKHSKQDISTSEKKSFEENCVIIANDSIKESKAFKSDSEKEQLEILRTEISKRMEKVNTEEGPMWKCTECGKQFNPKVKTKLEYHVETHLEGFTHTCGQCDKVHKTRYALQQHTSLRHKGGNKCSS